VRAASDGQRQVALSRKANQRNDVCAVSRPPDDGRTLVDHRVPHLPRLVVACVLRRDDVATMYLPELLNRSRINHDGHPFELPSGEGETA
jgi:hypothetical protein